MTTTAIKKTYIIDDDSIFVFVLKKLLEKHHNFGQVVDFKDGHQALELLFSKNLTHSCNVTTSSFLLASSSKIKT